MVRLSVLLDAAVCTVLPAHTPQAGDATEQLLMCISFHVCRSGRKRRSERSHGDRSIALSRLVRDCRDHCILAAKQYRFGSDGGMDTTVALAGSDTNVSNR